MLVIPNPTQSDSDIAVSCSKQNGAATLASSGALAHMLAGGSPRIVTTGETNSDSNPGIDCTEDAILLAAGRHGRIVFKPVPLDTASAGLAHIDWLSITFTPHLDEGKGLLEWLIPQMAEVFNLPASMFYDSCKGWNGYDRRIDIVDAEKVIFGLVAFGGKHQRGTVHLSLTGTACAHVTNWLKVKEWGRDLKATIKRIDLAHDDLLGVTFDLEKMASWYMEGQFNVGGRQPTHEIYGDWLIEGSPNGRTLYIGKRENGKMLRIYEKGKQLGDPLSPWVRVELELRAENRLIPWDAITESGKYLAGSYPCLNFLSVEQEKIKTLCKAATISYDRSVTHARMMVGKLVNVMMMENYGDAFEVIDKLKREGTPERLKGHVEYLSHALEGD